MESTDHRPWLPSLSVVTSKVISTISEEYAGCVIQWQTYARARDQENTDLRAQVHDLRTRLTQVMVSTEAQERTIRTLRNQLLINNADCSPAYPDPQPNSFEQAPGSELELSPTQICLDPVLQLAEVAANEPSESRKRKREEGSE